MLKIGQLVKLESRSHRVMVSWIHRVILTTNPTISCKVMESWSHGVMESWSHGVMESWSHGVTKSRSHGVMVSWSHTSECYRVVNGPKQTSTNKAIPTSQHLVPTPPTSTFQNNDDVKYKSWTDVQIWIMMSAIRNMLKPDDSNCNLAINIHVNPWTLSIISTNLCISTLKWEPIQ